MIIHSKDIEPDINLKPVSEIDDPAIDYVSDNFHYVDSLHIDEARLDVSHAKTTPYSQYKILSLFIFSAVIHVLLFYGISVKFNVPSITDNAPKPPILRAQLYYTPPKHSRDFHGMTEADKQSLRASPEVEKAALPAHSNNPKGATREYSGVISSLDAPAIQEPYIHGVEELSEPPADENVKSSRSVFTRSAGEHLKQQETRKVNQLASKAHDEQKRNAIHPEIKVSPKNSLTQNGLLQESVKIEVDCNTTTGKIANFISANTGVSAQDRDFPDHHTPPGEPIRGTVKCRKGGDIESFINNRIRN